MQTGAPEEVGAALRQLHDLVRDTLTAGQVSLQVALHSSCQRQSVLRFHVAQHQRLCVQAGQQLGLHLLCPICHVMVEGMVLCQNFRLMSLCLSTSASGRKYLVHRDCRRTLEPWHDGRDM